MSEDEDRSIASEAEGEAQERRRRRTGAARIKDIQKAYRNVMATEDGRTVLWDILASLGTYKTPLVPGAQDLTYCAIGRQNAGLELTARLHIASPGGFITMQQEHMKENEK